MGRGKGEKKAAIFLLTGRDTAARISSSVSVITLCPIDSSVASFHRRCTWLQRDAYRKDRPRCAFSPAGTGRALKKPLIYSSPLGSSSGVKSVEALDPG